MIEILKAADLLSQYVTHGSLSNSNSINFEDIFRKVKILLPLSLRSSPPQLYRSLVISSQQMDHLNAGGILELEDRFASSWSMDKLAAEQFLRSKCEDLAPSKAGMIYCKTIDQDLVIANIQAVYRLIGWDSPDVEEWLNYVEWEKEVLVENRPYLNTVKCEDVIHFEVMGQAQSFSVLRPYLGEYVATEHEEFTVHGIMDNQNEIAKESWSVICKEESRLHHIKFEGGYWHTITPKKKPYRKI